jgi:hypothetical protein
MWLAFLDAYARRGIGWCMCPRRSAELVVDGLVLLVSTGSATFLFESDAANLFFQLVSARDERASIIVTSNKPFGHWGAT